MLPALHAAPALHVGGRNAADVYGWPAGKGKGMMSPARNAGQAIQAHRTVHPSVLQGHGRATEHKPELVLNNFGTRIGRRVGRMFASLFAQVWEGARSGWCAGVGWGWACWHAPECPWDGRLA